MHPLAIFTLGCFTGFIMTLFGVCLSVLLAKKKKCDDCDCCAPEGGEFRSGDDYKPKRKTPVQP